jgi:hypothetical protein
MNLQSMFIGEVVHILETKLEEVRESFANWQMSSGVLPLVTYSP